MILPRDVAEAALAANRHGKIPLNKLPVSNAAGAPYLGGWKLIADALGVDFKPFG
jgi:hypothetical protein